MSEPQPQATEQTPIPEVHPVVQEPQPQTLTNEQPKGQPENPPVIGQVHVNGDKPEQKQSPSEQQRNSNQEPHSKNNNNEESPSDGEKSDNVEENKSENEQDEEEESNGKSEDKDEDEDRSGEDTKKEEPSGKKCFNKLCNSKKIFKKLRSKVEHAKYRFLCRPCYQNYCNNDFCEFCQQIYSSTGNADDDDQWIGCDECNRWNHIECEKKYRNKNIHETKDQDTPYLCLTCSYKFKKDPSNEKKPKNPTTKDYTAAVDDSKLLKQKLQISKDQRIQIFNRKIESLPSLQYFLQNYNFRLWINENLIKDDLEILRQAAKKNLQEGKKGGKKVKVQ